MNKGKFKIWHAALICLTVFIIFGALATFTIRSASDKLDGQWWEIFEWNLPGKDYDIDQAETFSADEIASIDSISLGSVSTTINVTTGGDKLSAHLYGTYRSRTGELALKTSQSGGNLIIKIDYAKAKNITTSDLHFDIVLPEGYSGDLLVDTVSGAAHVEADALNLNTLNVKTTSGRIQISDVSAKDVALKSVSGKIETGSIVNSENISLRTTSGKITTGMLSGNVTSHSVSGKISLKSDCSGDMDIDTTSGDVNIALPQDCGFQIDFGTVSGSFDCAAPMTFQNNGSRKFKGTHGDGSTSIKVKTVSGSCAIIID